MSFPTFFEIQTLIETVGITDTISSLKPLAEADVAGRLLQCALDLSQRAIRRDPTQLAAQLIGRLRPHRHIATIGAFLASITLPAGTLQALDTGHSTHIEAYIGTFDTDMMDAFQVVLPEVKTDSEALLRQGVWLTLPDGRAIRHQYGSYNRHYMYTDTVLEVNDRGLIKPFRFKKVKNVRKRYQLYFQRFIRLPSGRELVIFHSGIMLLIDPKTLQAVMMEQHIYSVRGALELTDGRLLTWSGDYTLRLWQADGTPITALQGHQAGVWGALELPDGRILSWSKDKTIRLWTSDGQPLTVMHGHTRAVLDGKPLADGRFISFSQDNTLRVWSPDGQPLLEMVGHQKWVTDVVELRNGWFVSWAMREPFLRFWDAKGKLQATVELKNYYFSHRLDVLEAEKLYEQLQQLPHSPDATWHGSVLQIIPLRTGGFFGLMNSGRVQLWSADGLKLYPLEAVPAKHFHISELSDGSFRSIVPYQTQECYFWGQDGRLTQVLPITGTHHKQEKNELKQGLSGQESLISDRLDMASTNVARRIFIEGEGSAVYVFDADTRERIYTFHMDYYVQSWAILSRSPLRLAIGDKSGRIAVVEAVTETSSISVGYGEG